MVLPQRDSQWDVLLHVGRAVMDTEKTVGDTEKTVGAPEKEECW